MEQNIRQRIDSLRAFMASHKLGAFIIPSSDPHQSEYVAPYWETRKWLSGFTTGCHHPRSGPMDRLALFPASGRAARRKRHRPLQRRTARNARHRIVPEKQNADGGRRHRRKRVFGIGSPATQKKIGRRRRSAMF